MPVVGNVNDNYFVGVSLPRDLYSWDIATNSWVNQGNLKDDNTAVKLTGNQTIADIKTFSSNIVGNITGNSATATKLATTRTINGVSFDGTANITVSDSTAVKLAGNQTIAGVKTFSSTVVGSVTGNSGTSTKLQTAITINGVAFDGSTNITISDGTAVKLTGNETIAGVKTFSSGIVGTLTGSITGNAATATKLQAARTINGVAFDGSTNITAPTNLGITAGTTAGPIVTSSTGTNATLPSASATASGVVTTGSQTFEGVKTFSSSPIVPKATSGNQALSFEQIAYNVDTSSYIPNTLSSGAIIETGSNSNGEYIKFADGTMIMKLGFTRMHNSSEFNFTQTTPHTFTGMTIISIQGATPGSAIQHIDKLRVGGTGQVTLTTATAIGSITGAFNMEVSSFNWGITVMTRWK